MNYKKIIQMEKSCFRLSLWDLRTINSVPAMSLIKLIKLILARMSGILMHTFIMFNIYICIDIMKKYICTNHSVEECRVRYTNTWPICVHLTFCQMRNRLTSDIIVSIMEISDESHVYTSRTLQGRIYFLYKHLK